MFSSSGLFKHLQCPNGDRCRLTNCIFSHDVLKRNALATTTTIIDNGKLHTVEQRAESPPSAKRRRIDTRDTPLQNPASNLPGHTDPDALIRPSKPANGENAHSKSRLSSTRSSPARKVQDAPLRSAARTVSPPPTSRKAKTGQLTGAEKTTRTKAETLNPRMIPNDPAGHAKRTVYLKALHTELQLLNEQVRKDADQQAKDLYLDEASLIKIALDEEEKIAREQPAIYANVIKLQIAKHRKMTTSEWIESRRKAESAKRKIDTRKGIVVETGLSTSEELAMLKRMIINQHGIDQWGYVTSPPTEAEAEAARVGVAASGGYEECDRCKTRFQVFPDRREDGSLTSGGKCTYHWGKKFFPKREKTDAIKGAAEPRYTCCNELLGTHGCTEAPTHVFKISEAKRLAAVLPFEATPSGANKDAFDAICFDCEMGYTVYGLELIRLTAVSWPEGHALLDVLVRPIGAILDLNTRFSGVSAEQIANAKEFNATEWESHIAAAKNKQASSDADQETEDLRIVSSPAAARSLLARLMTDQTLLVGHALENDLNAVRLVHPRIVDTVFLFPHPRGLPLRYGLRQLALQFLERHIQAAGAAGHSSLEDARATGDVARWKVKKEWDKLRLSGWTVKNGSFFAPGQADVAVANLPEYEHGVSLSGEPPTKKRKTSTTQNQVDGAEDTGDSDRN